MHPELRLVTPLERLMYLRTLPLFGGLRAAELAVLAEHAVERRFGRGELLTRADEPVDAMYILVNGLVRVSLGGSPVRTFGPGDSVGVFALLAGKRQEVEGVGKGPVLTLEVSGRTLFQILEERFTLLHHVLRETAGLLRAELTELELGYRPGNSPIARQLPERELDLVERLVVLHRVMPFGRDDPAGLGTLARRAREITRAEGDPLWRAGEPASSMLAVVGGSIAQPSESWGDDSVAETGALLGFVDLVAERERLHDASARTAIRALEIDREALIDVLEDRFDMAAECVAVLARRLLETFEQHARASDDLPAGLTSPAE